MQRMFQLLMRGEGLNPNLDDPRQQYDYRGAYLAGAEPDKVTGHWPSEFKLPGHPRKVLYNIDTTTGEMSGTVPPTPTQNIFMEKLKRLLDGSLR